jgi:hypothetical protein
LVTEEAEALKEAELPLVMVLPAAVINVAVESGLTAIVPCLVTVP